MPRATSNQNAGILEYALQHLERERDEIQARIDHVRRQLGGRAAGTAPALAPAQSRQLAAGPRRINPLPR